MSSTPDKLSQLLALLVGVSVQGLGVEGLGLGALGFRMYSLGVGV